MQRPRGAASTPDLVPSEGELIFECSVCVPDERGAGERQSKRCDPKVTPLERGDEVAVSIIKE